MDTLKFRHGERVRGLEAASSDADEVVEHCLLLMPWPVAQEIHTFYLNLECLCLGELTPITHVTYCPIW